MNSTLESERAAVAAGLDAARGAWQRDARHIQEFLDNLEAQRADPTAPQPPSDLFLIREEKATLWELIGLRLRGHPSVILVAVELPRHAGPGLNRTTLGQFLAKPPVEAAVQGVSAPAGLLKLVAPQVAETLPQFFERLRSMSSFASAIHVDVDLIDFAFDFRFSNPSALDHLKPPSGTISPTVFRTTGGHVLAGNAHSLYYTLRRDAQYITITDVTQHCPGRSYRLPTLCLNRKIISMERQLARDPADERQLGTLAFHPATAADIHIFGAVYGRLMAALPAPAH